MTREAEQGDTLDFIDLFVIIDYHKSGDSIATGELYFPSDNTSLVEDYVFKDNSYVEDPDIPNDDHSLGKVTSAYELKSSIVSHLTNYLNPGYLVRVFSLDGKGIIDDSVAKVNLKVAEELRDKLAKVTVKTVEHTDLVASFKGNPIKTTDTLKDRVNDMEIKHLNKLKLNLQRKKLHNGTLKKRHYLLAPVPHTDEYTRFLNLSPLWDKLEGKWYITDKEYNLRKGGYSQWLL